MSEFGFSKWPNLLPFQCNFAIIILVLNHLGLASSELTWMCITQSRTDAQNKSNRDVHLLIFCNERGNIEFNNKHLKSESDLGRHLKMNI